MKLNKNKILNWIYGLLGIGVIFAAGIQGQPSDMAQMYNNAPDIQAKYDIQGKQLKTKKAHKDDIEIKVGDILEDKPNMEINRWDGEVKMKIKPKLKGNINKVSTKNEKGKNKVVYETDKENYVFYDIQADTDHPEGAYEFEIVLNEIPDSNIVSVDIETDGLDFFYQPELTQQEIDDGAERPENVVGSYAVYHSTKQGDYSNLGGKNYKAGKAFHIYRPKIIDDTGDWVWGELNIANNELTITIDQTWLDNASYPVIVDPTFGYTTAGSSFGPAHSNMIDDFTGIIATSGSDADNTSISKVTFYGYSFDTSATPKSIITNSSGIILTNGVSPASPTISSSQDWYDVDYSTKPSISASTVYWLGLTIDTGQDLTWKFDTVSNQGRFDSSNSFSSPTNPTDASTKNEKFSIYATYTEDASGITTSTVQTVDLTTPTSTAWMGEDYATATPVAWDRTEWLKGYATFTTAETGLASTTNSEYATTTASTTDTYWEYFGNIAQEYEFTLASTTSKNLLKKLVYTWDGYATPQFESGFTGNGVESTVDIELYLKDFRNDQYVYADSLNYANCSTTACTGFEYTTSTDLGRFIDDNLTVGFLIQKYEAYGNCSSSMASTYNTTSPTMTCGKPVYASTTAGNTRISGCEAQLNTEDLWSQCSTSSNTCFTGNCNGVSGYNTDGKYSCGIFADAGYHNCDVCHYCDDVSPSSSCASFSDNWFSPLNATYGCDTPCSNCDGGSCVTSYCEGLQCGCNPGEICSSGFCIAESSPTCNEACQGDPYYANSGGCYVDSGTCIAQGGTVDGNSTDCGLPKTCCCFY